MKGPGGGGTYVIYYVLCNILQLITHSLFDGTEVKQI